ADTSTSTRGRRAGVSVALGVAGRGVLPAVAGVVPGVVLRGERVGVRRRGLELLERGVQLLLAGQPGVLEVALQGVLLVAVLRLALAHRHLLDRARRADRPGRSGLPQFRPRRPLSATPDRRPRPGRAASRRCTPPAATAAPRRG